MSKFFSTITAITILSLFNTANFCMELVPQQPKKAATQNGIDFSKLQALRPNIRECIRGFDAGNQHLVERELIVMKANRNLCYLIRPSDEKFAQPYPVSLCPYDIANYRKDADMTVFLDEIKWPKGNSSTGIIRKPTNLLLACIINEPKEIISLLSNLEQIKQEDPETLQDCLFVAIDNAIADNILTPDQSFITSLFKHPYIRKEIVKYDLKKYIDFAILQTQTTRHTDTNFVVPALKELEKIYLGLPNLDNLNIKDLEAYADGKNSFRRPNPEPETSSGGFLKTVSALVRTPGITRKNSSRRNTIDTKNTHAAKKNNSNSTSKNTLDKAPVTQPASTQK